MREGSAFLAHHPLQQIRIQRRKLVQQRMNLDGNACPFRKRLCRRHCPDVRRSQDSRKHDVQQLRQSLRLGQAQRRERNRRMFHRHAARVGGVLTMAYEVKRSHAKARMGTPADHAYELPKHIDSRQTAPTHVDGVSARQGSCTPDVSFLYSDCLRVFIFCTLDVLFLYSECFLFSSSAAAPPIADRSILYVSTDWQLQVPAQRGAVKQANLPDVSGYSIEEQYQYYRLLVYQFQAAGKEKVDRVAFKGAKRLERREAQASRSEADQPLKPQGLLAAFKKREYDQAVKAYRQRQQRDRNLVEQAAKLQKKVQEATYRSENWAVRKLHSLQPEFMKRVERYVDHHNWQKQMADLEEKKKLQQERGIKPQEMDR